MMVLHPCSLSLSQITAAVVPTLPGRTKRSSRGSAGTTSAAARRVKCARVCNCALLDVCVDGVCYFQFLFISYLLIISRWLLHHQNRQWRLLQQRKRDICLHDFTPWYTHIHAHSWIVFNFKFGRSKSQVFFGWLPVKCFYNIPAWVAKTTKQESSDI